MSNPICKECQKQIKGEAKIIVNQKTLEDYRLCSTCAFFKNNNIQKIHKKRRSHDEVITVNRKKSMARLKRDPMQADLSELDNETLRKVMNCLASKTSREKDPAKKKMFSARLALIRKVRNERK